jgi:23S rRNA pseudouridine1911/1915/1917 synthase
MEHLTGDDSNDRIDVWLCRHFGSTYSRGYFQRLIDAGKVSVNAKKVSSHYRVRPDDEIDVELAEKEPHAIAAEDIPLDVLHEDDDIIVINKPVGLVVHPACGHPTGTLLNALWGRAAGKYQPMLVHRLDKDTSGVMVVAKNERAKNSLVRQFQKRSVRKVYLAAVLGCVTENKGLIEAPLGRSPEDRKKNVVGPLATKPAVTEFTVVYRSREYSLLEAHPVTGRTHQIRSHMAYIGHPVLGDITYGGPGQIKSHVFGRQMLHAYHLMFTHPSSGKRVEFTAPPPEDVREIWKEARHV